MAQLYQVDYSVESSGKRVNITKRRIRWLWGIPNKDALTKGSKGVQCRGCEHEVTLVWSLTSGKRLVLLDGKEVHFSNGRRSEGKFQYSWAAQGLGNLVLTISAHATVPLRSNGAFKQYDLLIDGQSCSSLPHLNQVGMQVCHTKNHKLVLPQDVQDGITIRPIVSHEEKEWERQALQIEQKREIDLTDSTPYRRSQSLNTTRNNNMEQGIRPQPRRQKSVTFSMDIDNVDLLSTELPSQFNNYPVSYHDEFKVALDSDPKQVSSYDSVFSTIMDAYDSGNATQQVDLQNFERGNQEQNYNIISPK